MRSILSSEMAEKSNSLLMVVGSLTRTPSTSTSVWPVSPPRRRTVAAAPGPPDWVTVTPGTVRSIWATEVGDDCSISSRVMTETALPAFPIAIGR